VVPGADLATTPSTKLNMTAVDVAAAEEAAAVARATAEVVAPVVAALAAADAVFLR
jgi:hypothetical protein